MLNDKPILVVDDEPDIVDLYKDKLEDQGFKPVCFTDVDDALNSLSEHDYYLGIVDYKMPKLNGIEFCKKVKERISDIKFIMISGAINAEDIKDVVALEIVDCLTKPVNDDVFFSKINQVKSEIVKICVDYLKTTYNIQQ